MARIALLALVAVASTAAATPPQYSDGRPAATMRMDAKDHGIVLRYGDGPDECDILGDRDVWVFEADGTYYMHYDAAGPSSWAKGAVGLPTVLKISDDKLALVYDGGKTSVGHLGRHIGLATIDLPLNPPGVLKKKGKTR